MDEKIKVNNVIDNSDMIAVTCDIADMIMDAKYQGDPNLYMTIVDDEGTYRQIKLSKYNKLLHEEQMNSITEVRTVMDHPPEAKRY